MSESGNITHVKKQKTPNHGENIRRARNFRGFSAEDMAKRIGKSKSTLLDWEKQQTLSEEILSMVSKATGVDLLVLRDHATEDTTIAPKGYIDTFNNSNYSNAVVGADTVDVFMNGDPKSLIAEITKSFKEIVDPITDRLLQTIEKLSVPSPEK